MLAKVAMSPIPDTLGETVAVTALTAATKPVFFAGKQAIKTGAKLFVGEAAGAKVAAAEAGAHNSSNVVYSQLTSANLAKFTHELEKKTLKRVFNKDGTLTKTAIDEAYEVQKVMRYNDKSPIKIELSKLGNIENWIKARTQKFHTGLESLDVGKSKLIQTADVHFYKNIKTGEVYDEELKIIFATDPEYIKIIDQRQGREPYFKD